MAESQLTVMEDGRIGVKVPETKPEFYYSEEQRAAIELLLKEGDGAFKTRLKEDKMKDFLSAREVKLLTNTFRPYDSGDDSKASTSRSEQGATGTDADSGVHSTYWPQMSDTEVPPLDIGWPNGAYFKGVTRVSVHTHPPKDNGPHIKEVVRRLIQEASKNIRARTLQGTGFNLSFGRLPGSLCNKYMLVDGDKVVYGSYSFSWCTSRMDRNMITVMTGQPVDFFDRDFRELYAISEKMNLYKEFHVSPPAAHVASTVRSKPSTKRPPLAATTSRFQVSLGDSRNNEIQVPAHKFYNPKYALAFGDTPRPAGSLQEPKRGLGLAEVPEEADSGSPRLASSEKMDQLSPLPAESLGESFKRKNGVNSDIKSRSTLRQKLFKRKSQNKLPVNTEPVPPETKQDEENEDNCEVVVLSPSKVSKKPSRLGRKSMSEQTVNAAHDNMSLKSQHKGRCKVS
ncbi:protein FAM83F isoform X2 [Oreochromis niloticus]|uniref:protein FAM83F isoform X2 n=1 Tax=Oreochromis niloticus TaxID=8128 RepID=UPI000904E0E9|nr:protein FAM83F isoform X2 [Oreochromis niloticus]